MCGISALRLLAPRLAPVGALQGGIDSTFKASVYDIDSFGARKSDVRARHHRRRRAVCCLDVGGWESCRPDGGRFPRSVIGRRCAGYPDERWLDISRFHLFAKRREQRMAAAPLGS